jgi:hypothetical protein
MLFKKKLAINKKFGVFAYRLVRESCFNLLGRYRHRVLTTLLIGYLVYFIVVIAKTCFPGFQHGVARISSMPVARAIKVHMAHDDHNRIVNFVHHFSVLNADDLFARNVGVFVLVQAVGNTLRNHGPNLSIESLVNVSGKPLICLFQGVPANKYCSISANLHGRRFSVIHQEVFGLKRSAGRVNGERFYGRNNVRPLISLKLSFTFGQRAVRDDSQAIGSHSLLSNFLDKQIRLFPTTLHFRQLPPHAIPLEKSNDDSNCRAEGHNPRENKHPPFIFGKPLFKVGYVGILALIAFAICLFALWHIRWNWNRRGLFVGLLLYSIAGAIIFHAVWVLLFF